MRKIICPIHINTKAKAKKYFQGINFTLISVSTVLGNMGRLHCENSFHHAPFRTLRVFVRWGVPCRFRRQKGTYPGTQGTYHLKRFFLKLFFQMPEKFPKNMRSLKQSFQLFSEICTEISHAFIVGRKFSPKMSPNSSHLHLIYQMSNKPSPRNFTTSSCGHGSPNLLSKPKLSKQTLPHPTKNLS